MHERTQRQGERLLGHIKTGYAFLEGPKLRLVRKGDIE